MGNKLGNPCLPTDVRRKQIFAAAVSVASRPQGLRWFTRKAIAKKAYCSEALVSMHLGDMKAIRKAVLTHAIENEIVPILVQVIATLKPELRRKIASQI